MVCSGCRQGIRAPLGRYLEDEIPFVGPPLSCHVIGREGLAGSVGLESGNEPRGSLKGNHRQWFMGVMQFLTPC